MNWGFWWVQNNSEDCRVVEVGRSPRGEVTWTKLPAQTRPPRAGGFGPDDLEGLFQPKPCYDSMACDIIICLHGKCILMTGTAAQPLSARGVSVIIP